MDGNGRWATARGKARSAGHRAGARRVRGIVEAAPNLGIGTLTLYAFSADNWQRPPSEVTALMRLYQIYLRTQLDLCLKNDVRLTILGQREGLAPALRRAIEDAEAASSGGRLLHLRVALNYSARDAIVRAAAHLNTAPVVSRADFAHILGLVDHNTGPAPDVDLLIRTGGEQRLSDFLLWECAYAELIFSPYMWPDFTPGALEAAVAEFHARERRFGRVPLATPAPPALVAAAP